MTQRQFYYNVYDLKRRNKVHADILHFNNYIK